MANTPINLTSKQLRPAATIREKMDELEKQLGAIFSAAPEAPAAAPRTKKKGKLSAAGRANIRAAQRARWAKIQDVQQPAPRPKKKFTMSAAAKAAIDQLLPPSQPPAKRGNWPARCWRRWA